jgi:hypothetical protein
MSKDAVLNLSDNKVDTEKMLEFAVKSADFILLNGFNEAGLAYFSLDEKGKPHTF